MKDFFFMNELSKRLSGLQLDSMTTTSVDIQSLIDTAVNAAVNRQRIEYDRQIAELTHKVSELRPIRPPVLEIYEEIRIVPGLN